MANDLNSVMIVGRMTRDAELKYLPSGTPVASFSLAVNRKKKSGDQWVDEASFFDVNYFGKGAEAVNQYLQKGKQLAVQGELRQSRWEKEGQQRSKVEIVASNVQLLGGKDAGGHQQAPQPSQAQTASKVFEDDGNIPF